MATNQSEDVRSIIERLSPAAVERLKHELDVMIRRMNIQAIDGRRRQKKIRPTLKGKFHL